MVVVLAAAVGRFHVGGGQPGQHQSRGCRSQRVVSRSRMVPGKDRRARRSSAKVTVGLSMSTV